MGLSSSSETTNPEEWGKSSSANSIYWGHWTKGKKQGLLFWKINFPLVSLQLIICHGGFGMSDRGVSEEGSFTVFLMEKSALSPLLFIMWHHWPSIICSAQEFTMDCFLCKWKLLGAFPKALVGQKGRFDVIKSQTVVCVIRLSSIYSWISVYSWTFPRFQPRLTSLSERSTALCPAMTSENAEQELQK